MTKSEGIMICSYDAQYSVKSNEITLFQADRPYQTEKRITTNNTDRTTTDYKLLLIKQIIEI